MLIETGNMDEQTISGKDKTYSVGLQNLMKKLTQLIKTSKKG